MRDTLNAPWLLTNRQFQWTGNDHLQLRWLNSASWVLISTFSAPLVETGQHKQFSLFDLDLWPTTLTYNPRLSKVKVEPHVKNQAQRSNGSNRRVPTDKRTDTHAHTRTLYTKRIISPATRSIKIDCLYSALAFKKTDWPIIKWHLKDHTAMNSTTLC